MADLLPRKLSRQSSTVSALSFRSQVVTQSLDSSNKKGQTLLSRSVRIGSDPSSPLNKKRLLSFPNQPPRLSHSNVTPLELNQVHAEARALLQALEHSDRVEHRLISGEDGYYHRFDRDRYAKQLERIQSGLNNKEGTTVSQQRLSEMAVKLHSELRQLSTQIGLKRLPSVMDDIRNHVNRAITVKINTSLRNIGLSPFRASKIPPLEKHAADHFLCYRGKPGLVDVACYPEAVPSKATINLFIHGAVAKSTLEGWAQPGSSQAQLVTERFGGQTTSFRWNGTHQKEDRQAASKVLAELLGQYRDKQVNVNLFAHGHGGDVVTLALQTLYQTNQHPLVDETPYTVNFLALLGTPTSQYDALPSEGIKALARYYVNVACDHGFIATGKGAGVMQSPDATFSRNHPNVFAGGTVDKNADLILTVVDADHDQLCDFVVFNQLRDPNLSEGYV